MPQILIAGVGNVLLQDDGFGPHAIARLQADYELGEEVELLDLGTPGLDFVDYLVGMDVLIILDALSTGGAPGDILIYDREQLRKYLPDARLSAHQPCLQETLFMAETTGVCPSQVMLVGMVGASFDVSTELSAPMAEAMPEAMETVAEILRSHGATARRRSESFPLKTWWSAAASSAS